MRWLTVTAVALALIGCALEAPSASVADAISFFPRHDSPLGTGDAALLEGEAVYEEGCLWIETQNGERFLALWPSNVGPGMVNGQPAILTTDDELLVETGSVAQLGGSEADLAAAEDLVGFIPDPCESGSFWVVADVLNRP